MDLSQQHINLSELPEEIRWIIAQFSGRYCMISGSYILKEIDGLRYNLQRELQEHDQFLLHRLLRPMNFRALYRSVINRDLKMICPIADRIQRDDVIDVSRTYNGISVVSTSSEDIIDSNGVVFRNKIFFVDFGHYHNRLEVFRSKIQSALCWRYPLKHISEYIHSKFESERHILVQGSWFNSDISGKLGLYLKFLNEPMNDASVYVNLLKDDLKVNVIMRNELERMSLIRSIVTGVDCGIKLCNIAIGLFRNAMRYDLPVHADYQDNKPLHVQCSNIPRLIEGLNLDGFVVRKKRIQMIPRTHYPQTEIEFIRTIALMHLLTRDHVSYSI